MVEIDGKPLLLHQIELAKRYGIKEIFILSGHLSHVIEDYFADGAKFGVKIHHVVEPYPLGTAGSLKLLEGKLKDRFMVFYGDVVMDFDLDSFIKFDMAHNSVGTAIVHPNDHPYDSDLIETDKDCRIIKVIPKPHNDGEFYQNLVNAAAYIFSPEIFKFIEPNIAQDFGKHILKKVVDSGAALYAYKTPEYISEIEKLLNYTSNKKLQIIVYNTQSDFRESNFAYDYEDFYNQGGITNIYGTKIYIYFDGNRAHLVSF